MGRFFLFFLFGPKKVCFSKASGFSVWSTFRVFESLDDFLESRPEDHQMCGWAASAAKDGDGMEAVFYNFCGPGHATCRWGGLWVVSFFFFLVPFEKHDDRSKGFFRAWAGMIGTRHPL